MEREDKIRKNTIKEIIAMREKDTEPVLEKIKSEIERRMEEFAPSGIHTNQLVWNELSAVWNFVCSLSNE